MLAINPAVPIYLHADLPKLMLEELKKSSCIGIDDTQVKLIMPKEIPDAQSGEDEPQIQRLMEKMKEAKKANQDSIDAKIRSTTTR